MKKILSLFAAVLFAGSMMAGNALMATLDFTTNEWGLPEGSASGASETAQFTNGTQTITLSAADKYYFNKDGYLMLGKQGSTLTLPAFEWATSKIVITGRDAASGATKQNIFVGDEAVSTETTGVKGENEYAIAERFQAAGNVYVLKVTSAHNTQITKIDIYTACDTCTEPIAPVDSTEILVIDFTKNQGEWTINDVAKDTLPYVWQQTTQYGMKASAYTTAAHATESWLISPAIDMSQVDSATMTISHAMNKGNNSTLAVKASIDGENWEDVELSAWPAGTSWDFMEATADLSAYAGNESVKIAFVYVSTTANCPTWEIKKLAIREGSVEPEPEPEPEVTPEVPEGVLTCAMAVELAAKAEDPTAEEKEVEVDDVVVRGFVSFCYDLKPGETQQSAWLADLKSATSGVVQAYYANVTEAVAKGDYVEVAGKLVKYYKVGKDGKADEIILEIKNGTMKKVDPNAVENVFTTVKAQKVMMNGTLYIIRGNKMFDVRGAQVR